MSRKQVYSLSRSKAFYDTRIQGKRSITNVMYLEAKIVLGESLIVSIGSEFIENNGEEKDSQSSKTLKEFQY